MIGNIGLRRSRLWSVSDWLVDHCERPDDRRQIQPDSVEVRDQVVDVTEGNCETGVAAARPMLNRIWRGKARATTRSPVPADASNRADDCVEDNQRGEKAEGRLEEKGYRQDQPGEPDVHQQLRIGEDRGRSSAQRLAAVVEHEDPGEQIGDVALAGKDEPEDEEVDEAEQERVEHPPDQTEERRGVAGLDVASSQEPNEVTSVATTPTCTR